MVSVFVIIVHCSSRHESGLSCRHGVKPLPLTDSMSLFFNNGCAGRIHNTHAGERSCVLDLHIGFLCMVLDKEVDM